MVRLNRTRSEAVRWGHRKYIRVRVICAPRGRRRASLPVHSAPGNPEDSPGLSCASMAEMVKRLRWLFLVIAFVWLTSCDTTTQSSHTLTVTLVFDPNSIREGQTIHGFLVVNNPGPPIDMERDEVGFRCVPRLRRGPFREWHPTARIDFPCLLRRHPVFHPTRCNAAPDVRLGFLQHVHGEPF
jgi:hypothetical protein